MKHLWIYPLEFIGQVYLYTGEFFTLIGRGLYKVHDTIDDLVWTRGQ